MKRNSNGRHTRTTRPSHKAAQHPTLRRAGLLSGALATIAGGVGVGAALMYMMDPQSGASRRAAVRHAAHQAAHHAIDEAHGALHSAYGMAHAAKGEAKSLGSRVLHELHTHRQYTADAAQSLKDAAHNVLAQRQPRRHRVATAAAALGAVGFVAAGVGIVSMLDADRRARLMEKAGGLIHETGDLIGRTGRYVRDMAGDHLRGSAEHFMPSHEDEFAASPATPAQPQDYSSQTSV